FIPFTSVLVMPVRCLVVYVPGYELFISAAIMLITIILLSYLAIRIYRLGSLNYGNRMKFGPTIKMIFRGEDK
ncbi:MAG TPA: ABC transporter permease, partial [Candidatus Eisenbacteria bacterium]|nr:ABC transporter permease [Candidatus Eisenbacteria bacterium]